MKIKLSFEDFKLENDHKIVGGGTIQGTRDNYDTSSECTHGDEGCCDERHTDDTKFD